MAGDTQYQPVYINPDASNRVVASTDAPQMSPQQAMQGWEKAAQFGEDINKYTDALKKVADLNLVAQGRGQLGTGVNDLLQNLSTTSTGLDPVGDISRWQEGYGQLKSDLLDGANPQVSAALKTYMDEHEPSFDAEVRGILAKSARKAVDTTLDENRARLAKTAMQNIDPAVQDELWAQHQKLIDANVGVGLPLADAAARSVQDRQAYYGDIAKYQAENMPNVFRQRWSSGVWADKLSAEEIVKLEPYAQKALMDSTYNDLYNQYTGASGKVNALAAFKAAMDPNQTPGLTKEQRTAVAGEFHTLWTTQAAAETKAREDATRNNLTKIVNLSMSDPVAAYKMARDPNFYLPGTARLEVLNHLQTGAEKRNDPDVWSAGLSMVANGQWSDTWGLQKLASGQLSYEGFNRLTKIQKEADTPSLLALRAADNAINDAFKTSMMANGTPEQAESKLRAKMELLQYVEDSRRQGKNPTDLVTPGRPGYVLGDIIRRNQMTLDEQVQAATNKMSPGEGEGHIPPASSRPGLSREVSRGLGLPTPSAGSPLLLNTPQGGGPIPTRLPGETVQQYRARTGI